MHTTAAQSLLFVGGYAAADQPGIHVFRFDQSRGTLAAEGSFAGIDNPSFLIGHPGRRWLYAVGEMSRQQNDRSGSVWALRFDPEQGAIEPINQRPSGGDAPCHLALHSSGNWLVVSNYSSGSVAVLPILADGSLGEQTDLVQHHGSGADPRRQEGPHAHSATFSPDEHFVIVADLGLDQLLVYRFDASAGTLSPHGHGSARPGAGPRHLAFHPSGQQLYAANELDSTISVYDYDASGGTLRERQTLSTLPPGAPHSQVADIHVAPTGDRVYVSNRGHNSIAVFDIGADGRLAPLTIATCGGDWPRNFALAPGGRFLLVANQYSGDVSVLPLLDGAEPVGPPIAREPVARASCVQFV
jgi:6-phosphogluconolactonase